MEKKNILSEEIVLQRGKEFSGDVCYSGEFGQQVFDKPMEDGGTPIDGIIYEKYENGHLKYYASYENGILNGELAEFHKSGSLKSICTMGRGTIDGEKIEFYENGIIKSKKNCKYGLVLQSYEWDENRILISEKKNLTEREKRIFDKYEKLEISGRSGL